MKEETTVEPVDETSPLIQKQDDDLSDSGDAPSDRYNLVYIIFFIQGMLHIQFINKDFVPLYYRPT